MKEKVIKILQEINPEIDFTEEVNFIKRGILDSFDVVNLVTALELEFGISINGIDIVPENFENIESIKNLLNKTRQNYEPNIL